MRQTQYMIAFREYGKDDIIWQTSDFASLSYILNLDDVTEVEFVDLPCSSWRAIPNG
jgi:hypothetical protein